jgi:hypothetical protein
MTWNGFIDVSPAVTLVINETDYSAYLGQGRIESTLIDSGGSSKRSPEGKLWQGGFTLAATGLAAVDLDPTTNADFERGNLVTITARGNTWNWRIAEAKPTQWDGTLTPIELEIEVTCKLGFLNQEFTVEPVNTFRIGRTRKNPTTSTLTTLRFQVWTDAIKDDLKTGKDASGTPYLVDADFDFDGLETELSSVYFGGARQPDGFTTGQNRGKNPFINASGIASARGGILHCDPADERIRITYYPTEPADIDLRGEFALDQMIAVTPLLQPLDVPVEKLQSTLYSTKVAKPTDGGGDEEDMQSYPVTIPLASALSPGAGPNADPIVTCWRVEQAPSISGSTTTQEYTIEALSFWLFAKSPADTSQPNTSTAQITVCQGERTTITNGDGLPLTNNDVQSIIKGATIENGVPKSRLPITSSLYGDTTLVSGQGTRESFVYDSRGVPIERTKDARGTLVSLSQSDTPGAVNTDITQVIVTHREEEKNTYLPDGGYAQILSHQVAEAGLPPFNNDSTGLKPDPSQKPTARRIDGVRKPDSVKPAEEPIAAEEYGSEQRANSSLGKGKTSSIQSFWGAATQHATDLGRMVLALSQQGAISYDCERGIRDSESLAPCLSEYVGDRVLVRDGEAIEFDQNSLKLTYTGREIGRLASPVTVPKRPIVITETLVAGPMPDYTYTVGLPVSVQLVAFGGTPPYTYSVLSGLPSGLSLNTGTGVLSGTPDTVATGSFSWRVTDDLGATADDTFTITVRAVPVATPHYSFVVDLAARLRARVAAVVGVADVTTVGAALGGIGAGADVTVVQPANLTLGATVGGIGAAAIAPAPVEATLGATIGGIGAGAAVEPEVPWTPSEITTAGWWDASDSTTLFDATTGGSAVAADGAIARWEDKSGNARHWKQSTLGDRPLRKTAQVNSLDTVLFDGTSDGMLLDADLTFTSHTIFVMFRPSATITDASASAAFLTGGTFGSGTAETLLYAGSVTGNLSGERLSHLIVQDSPVAQVYGHAKTNADVSGVNQFALQWNDSTTTFAGYLNGNTDFAATSSAGGFSSGRKPTDIRYLGYRGLNNTAHLGADICEVVILSSAATTDTRQRVEGYLAHRWGTTASLPGGHPYKTNPPLV